MRAFAFAFVGSLGVVACSEPRATLEVTDVRAFRGSDERVVVDIDLVAHEGLGNNVGRYCTRATFAGQVAPTEVCSADLEDGDEKTVRIVSDGDLADEAAITVRVRLGSVDIGRSLVAPRH